MTYKPYYPYNKSFDYFIRGRGMDLKRAKQYIKYHNELKGGHWVLKKKKDYKIWLKNNPLKINPLLEAMINPIHRRVFPEFTDYGFVGVPALKMENK